jgi:hypothetical protein
MSDKFSSLYNSSQPAFSTLFPCLHTIGLYKPPPPPANVLSNTNFEQFLSCRSTFTFLDKDGFLPRVNNTAWVRAQRRQPDSAFLIFHPNNVFRVMLTDHRLLLRLISNPFNNSLRRINSNIKCIIINPSTRLITPHPTSLILNSSHTAPTRPQRQLLSAHQMQTASDFAISCTDGVINGVSLRKSSHTLTTV